QPVFVPSNQVDPTLTASRIGSGMISINTTFDSGTGQITGGIDREVGTGIASSIGYFQAPPSSTGGSQLGIFVFHDVPITSVATLRIVGTRAAVLLVGDLATIDGTIDIAAGSSVRSSPGPGGGAGGTGSAAAGGCGAGGAGMRGTPPED